MICPNCLTQILAEGTEPGTRSVPRELLGAIQPANDFADHCGINTAREIEIATARVAATVEVLRVLVQAFEREMSGGYTTPQQQTALARARAIVAEVG